MVNRARTRSLTGLLRLMDRLTVQGRSRDAMESVLRITKASLEMSETTRSPLSAQVADRSSPSDDLSLSCRRCRCRGGYTFIYARGYSFLTNDPARARTATSCRITTTAWTKSSHRAVAVCNDCHTPPGLIRKYVTKGVNGFNHSLAFTTGRFPEPTRITPRQAAVTEKAAANATRRSSAIEGRTRRGQLSCIRCHSTVGHLE